MPDLNWNAVYSFWLVAEHGSFAEAARGLPRGTVQALHKRVRGLEGERNLHLRLFRSRGVKGVELTEAGRRLHRFLDPVFKSFDSLVAELQGEDRGPLTLAMTDFAAYNYAHEILKRFHRRFPRVSADVRVGSPAEAIALAERGYADFAVCSPPQGTTPMVRAAGAPIHFEMICPRADRWERPLTWEQVVQRPVILLERSSLIRRALEDLLDRERLLSRLHVAAEVTTAELGVECVRAGLGICIVPVGPRLARRLRGVSRLDPPAGLPQIDIAILHRPDRYLPRYMREFAALAAEVIRAPVPGATSW